MYLSVSCPYSGPKLSLLKFLFLILLLIPSLTYSQSPMLPLPCGNPSILDTNCSDYITNGNFDNMYNYQIDALGDIHTANAWNVEEQSNGSWTCLVANLNAANKPDAFSTQTMFSNFQVPINLYSNGTSISDPSLDGQYAAINVYDNVSTSQDERTYLEQELSDFLYSGFTYKLIYKVYHAPVSDFTSNIGVYLTPNILNGYDFSIPLLNSEILHNTPNTSSYWQTIENTFTVGQSSTADNLKFITIGFIDQTIPDPMGTGQSLGIFYIDSIHLNLVSAPDTIINDTLCGIDASFNIAAIAPHNNGDWSVVSGAVFLDNETSEDVDVYLPFQGNFSLQYSFTCDTVTYTETYNYTLIQTYELEEDSIVVCEEAVDLTSYINGLSGEWSVVSGDGEFNGNVFSGYGIGTTIINFVPDVGQNPCLLTSYEFTILFTPYPKTTSQTFTEDVWNDVVIDSYGNIYTVGTYTSFTQIEGISFDNGISAIEDKEQFMVAKYNPCGELLWFAWGQSTCPSNNMGRSTGIAIAIDEVYQRVYIAGAISLGMRYRNSNGMVYDVLNSPMSGCTNDTQYESYVMELNSENGNFEDFLRHFPYNLKINSMDVAKEGPFVHSLYLGGYSTVGQIRNGCIIRINTTSNFSSTLNLIHSNYQKTTSSFNNEINDIFCKGLYIYTVGTTEGSLTFYQQQININSNNFATTAWVAKTTPIGSVNFNVVALNHGGESGTGDPVRRMSGEQIYVDQYDNVIISGLFSRVIVNPFSSSNVYLLSQSIAFNSTDLYILRLNQNLSYNYGKEVIETTLDQTTEISEMAMTGYKDNIYISATYNGNSLHFQTSNVNFNNGGSGNNRNIVIAHYFTNANNSNHLQKTWHNTTLGFDPDDNHYVKSMCSVNDKVYTVGDYEERMDFQNNNFGPIDNILSDPGKSNGFIFRNDNPASGMFKSLDDDFENTSFNKLDNENSIYPNPNNGSFTIKGCKEFDQIEITNAIGKNIIFTKQYSNGQAFIQLANFTGLAIIKINGKGYRVLIQ